MKQRLCLARALIHDPKVLILDEPASGLDPRARVEMRDILRQLKNMGKTILISSHILPELAEMCDEIGVIDAGRLIAHGSVGEIQAQLAGERQISVKIKGLLEYAVTFFEEDPFVSKVEIQQEKNSVIFNYRGTEEDQISLLKKALDHNIRIISFSETETNLEDVFMEITKGAK
jgi:ABC-2 type transport system ATP-binding protein